MRAIRKLDGKSQRKIFCYRIHGKVEYNDKLAPYQHDIVTRREIKYCLRAVVVYIEKYYKTKNISIVTINQCSVLKGMKVVVK